MKRLVLRSATILFLLPCVVSVGCLGETELVTPPPPPPATLTLEFKAEDVATAQALGWENGIPGVEVTLTPEDTTKAELRFRGSAQGTLSLDGVPSGRYVVNAVRWLTDGERTGLPAGDDAVGFLTRSILNTTAAASSVPLRLVASRRGGIVLSEWSMRPIVSIKISTEYAFSGYLRLYNNGETTAYLDGLVIGSAFSQGFDYPNFPCSSAQPFQNDPEGVWAIRFQRLPGRGTDYPLLPGATVVVATDAIDHTVLIPEGLDLRQSTFEFLGYSDVDNPAVPNAEEIGLRQMFLGHGLFYSILDDVVFVSRPVVPEVLRRRIYSLNGTEWVRFPKDKLVEVVAIGTTYEGNYPKCRPLVHVSFDRQELNEASDPLVAFRRALAPITIDGQPVLQHTRWSAVDFTVAPRDPFARP